MIRSNESHLWCICVSESWSKSRHDSRIWKLKRNRAPLSPPNQAIDKKGVALPDPGRIDDITKMTSIVQGGDGHANDEEHTLVDDLVVKSGYLQKLGGGDGGRWVVSLWKNRGSFFTIVFNEWRRSFFLLRKSECALTTSFFFALCLHASLVARPC